MPGNIEDNMRILLDHNLPGQLAEELPTCAVSTARPKGWEELENGDLLKFFSHIVDPCAP
jgi:hypothetical protein